MSPDLLPHGDGPVEQSVRAQGPGDVAPRTAAVSGLPHTGEPSPSSGADLDGRSVLLPRAERPGHRDRLADALRDAGARVVGVPLTRTVPSDPAPLVAALEELVRGHCTWLVITSPRTVDAFGRLDACDTHGAPDVPVTTLGPGADRSPAGAAPGAATPSRPSHPLAAVLDLARAHGTRVAAVGRASARALTEQGVTVDVIAAGSALALLTEDALTRSIPEGGRVLLPCSRLSPPDLAEGLRRAGWQVSTVAAYDTVPVDTHDLPDTLREEWARGRFDAALITSASTARACSDLLGAPHPGTRLVALGTASARAASAVLRAPDAVSTSPTPSAVVDALRETFHDHPHSHPDQENM